MRNLDFSRRNQRRGAFPDVRRALAIYWQVEDLRAEGLSLRGAFYTVGQRSYRSPESVQYQWTNGRDYDAALRDCWGPLYQTLVDETRGKL